ncbi:MAG: cytochrome b/b6 domain-containing protein [Proteobacteria bacterium]|jgi:formate dehydrogenase subunit gamma|nr:cytochrome b/b6 domain-containing protein [Pseudomonadota bacterium]MBK7117455.1 cytochrome b/b6 domain-containing protein [Pseudomonadota bacterium]MBK9251224.1 cytochrome b/b6 domain-containing protein [Pseudomonadota bacterium]
MASDNQKIIRHAGIDRAFHWVMAAIMLVLLATSLLPMLGVRFAWYGVHWVSGLLLTVIIALHVLRALFWQKPRGIMIKPSDLKAGGAGKYTLAQKLMHQAWTVAVLVAIVTGLLLLRKAGVPFLERDPYVRSMASWGIITLLHDLAALLSVFLVLVHVYFAILPEKRAYLRAMTKGFISRSDLAREHDLNRVDRGE